MNFNLYRAIILLIACSLCSAALAYSQNPEPATAPPQPNDVKLSLIVTDGHNHSVEDVRREDLQLYEDGVLQTITSCEREELPVDYVLMVDNSASMKQRIDLAVEVAEAIVTQNKSDDMTALIRFVNSENINVVRDFTSNISEIKKGLDDLILELGQTALTDAVYLSAQHLTESDRKAGHRKAIVLISDGDDRESYYGKGKLFQLLAGTDIQIFAIAVEGYYPPGRRADAIKYLKRLSEQTGGRAFFPKTQADYSSAVQEIAHDLHTQFVVHYTPAPNPKSKAFRKVEVKVAESQGREMRNAITRAGYCATTPCKPR